MEQRVLIVEDNPDGRESLCQLVQLWGCQVEAAADGVQGVEKGLTWKPDTAVVDIGLPRLDGYQVAARLRQALGAGIRLIALTAYNQEESRRQAFRAGFDYFFCKPPELEALQQVLETSPAS